MYRQIKNPFTDLVYMVLRIADMASIPFAPDNTDYQKFKVDVAAGVPLEDPDGNVMTQTEADAFLETLP